MVKDGQSTIASPTGVDSKIAWIHQRTHQSDVGWRKESAPDLYWKLIHLHVTMPRKTVGDPCVARCWEGDLVPEQSSFKDAVHGPGFYWKQSTWSSECIATLMVASSMFLGPNSSPSSSITTSEQEAKRTLLTFLNFYSSQNGACKQKPGPETVLLVSCIAIFFITFLLFTHSSPLLHHTQHLQVASAELDYPLKSPYKTGTPIGRGHHLQRLASINGTAKKQALHS